jgi:tetratricopeptide (TPR) repeat protein
LGSLLLLAGCALTGHPLDSPLPDHVPLRIHLTEIPFYAQAALQCGPAALAMALQSSGVDIRPDDLTAQVYTPGRKGSLQPELISAARRHRRLAYPIQGLQCLFEALAAGRPVVVLQNLGLSWIPRWHYAVVVGYDLSRSQVILHTGKTADREVGLSTFDRTWRRADQWGLLVLPAGEMPVCAEEPAYLQAAQGLQQAGHAQEASRAFAAAVGQWPASTPAFMAWGNALYASGDPQAAADAFRQATLIDPGNGPAFNNLAHILAEQGSLEAAETAARRAIALGGPQVALFRQTLEEILNKRALR